MNSVNANPEAAPVKSNFYPTFFLALFLGPFGAHRFYTGKIKSGILQFISFGGCGIWWLVDMLLLLLGKFKDKNNQVMPNVNPKLTWPIFAVLLAMCIAGGIAGSSPEASAGNPSSSSGTDATAGASSSSSVKKNAEKGTIGIQTGASGRSSSTSSSLKYVGRDCRGRYADGNPKGRFIDLESDSISIADDVDGSFVSNSGQIASITKSSDGKTIILKGEVDYTGGSGYSPEGTYFPMLEKHWTAPFTATINTEEKTMQFQGALIVDSLDKRTWNVTLKKQ